MARTERAILQFRARGEWSTCVASVDFVPNPEDPQTGDMTVHFQKRGSYVYRDVPADEAAGLQGASSQGTYFNLYIRDTYEYERVG